LSVSSSKYPSTFYGSLVEKRETLYYRLVHALVEGGVTMASPVSAVSFPITKLDGLYHSDFMLVTFQLPVSPTTIAWIRTVASLSILIIPLIVSTPPFRPVRRLFSFYLSDLVPLNSLVSSEPSNQREAENAQRYHIQIWRQIVLAGLAVIELGMWMAVVGSEILQMTAREESATSVVLSAGMVAAWVSPVYTIDYSSTLLQLYLFLLPILRPPSTPPWSVTIVYLLLWVLSIVNLCLAWYDRASTGYFPAWANTPRIVMEFGNIAATTCLVLVVSGLRLASPETLSRLVSAPL